jgi:hypothetical protein
MKLVFDNDIGNHKPFKSTISETLYLPSNQFYIMNSRLTLIAATFLVFSTTYAQFKKGDIMIGASLASLSYNSGSSDVSFPNVNGYTSKTTSFAIRIEPTIGFFISENTAVGGALNITPSGQKVRYMDAGTTFQEDKMNNFNLGLGAFVRHYFNKSTFMPFGQLGLNAGTSSGTTEGFKFYDAAIDYVVRYNGKSSAGFFANSRLVLGFTKMLGENAGLDIFGGYEYSYNKNTYKTTTTTDYGIDGSIETTAINEPTTKFTNHGFFIGAGFQVFLKKRK